MTMTLTRNRTQNAGRDCGVSSGMRSGYSCEAWLRSAIIPGRPAGWRWETSGLDIGKFSKMPRKPHLTSLDLPEEFANLPKSSFEVWVSLAL
jgi:hypothetical protein